jgi:probable rRNA maturation factor
MIILRKRARDLTRVTLGRFVARAQRAAGLVGPVNVLVTSNVEMRALNKRFRGKDEATDVLSFPMAVREADDHTAGEIAISAEIAARNARALGHSAAQEIKILVLHGVLHLRGYDHEQDNGQMAHQETRLRGLLRLPVGLLERTAASQNGKNGGGAAQKKRAPAARGADRNTQGIDKSKKMTARKSAARKITPRTSTARNKQ